MAPWTPAHPVVLPTMSDEEALRRRAENLAAEASAYGVQDPPDVGLIRWTSMADNAMTVAACLRDAGFNAVAGGNELGFPDGIGPAQQSAYQLARYVCDAEYTLHPLYREPFTEEQWGTLYDYWAQWLVPCLEGVGGHPPAPPTRETFVAQALQGTLVWDPYGLVQQTVEYGSSVEKSAWLSQTCPQEPNVIWGG